MINSGSNTVSVYSINAVTGQLRHNGYYLTRFAPLSVAVDGLGKFAYTTSSGEANVSAYAINGSNGALSPIAGSPFASGAYPSWVTVDPSNRFAYVANSASNNVSAYWIDSGNGSLTEMPGSPFDAGVNPQSVTVEPLG